METVEKADTSAPARKKWRSTTEALLPQVIHHREKPGAGYDIYPSHSLESGSIFRGYGSLASWIGEQKEVLIDGYVGVFWEEVQQALAAEFRARGLRVRWTLMAGLLKEEEEIERLVAPFLGAEGSVWGRKTDLDLRDFFRDDLVSALPPAEGYDLHIAIGVGAALLDREAPVVYLDLPKNELQFRMRAKAITNLGAGGPASPSQMYKRFYFVDWVVLNSHKKALLDRIAVVADAQWKDSLTWMPGAGLEQGLQKISRSVFRVRPWFEPGAWGGHWMQERIKGLNKEAINYAWSFELIVPENGLVFESDGNLLEVSFDFLMYRHAPEVLGRHAAVFGDEFPIRFDFLDTWEGGNLSIQCHPSLSYIRKHFGETLTQDETYYILDCQEDAKVYLGFQETIDPERFRAALEDSCRHHKEVAVEEYVQSFPAQKHDLFLIPNGTVHSAGRNNLVLEISATPYIFTFKMYDWLRLDLNGQPRPINIDHAFHNLDFDRKGDTVRRELIARPQKIDSGDGWELIHLPTHAAHYYDVHRIEFDRRVTVATAGSCHVLMLVEGTAMLVQTADGTEQEFHYAETVVIPAAAGSYTLTHLGEGRARVVKAFVKDEVHLPAL